MKNLTEKHEQMMADLPAAPVAADAKRGGHQRQLSAFDRQKQPYPQQVMFRRHRSFHLKLLVGHKINRQLHIVNA